jgi:hypothetical protein
MEIIEKFNEKNLKKEVKKDEKGRILVAENVPILINCSFNLKEEGDE